MQKDLKHVLLVCPLIDILLKASAFSLKVISTDYDLLSSLHETTFLSSYKIRTLCTSRFGKSFADAMLLFSQIMPCCSLIQYATLIGEYGVASALLGGGINPCSFARTEDSAWNLRSIEVSKLGMQKLIADLIPTSLAVYVIRYMFVMKMWSFIPSMNRNGMSTPVCEECPLCGMASSGPLLTFPAACNHKCCELCAWENVLRNISNRADGNVVKCPSCENSYDDDQSCSDEMQPSGAQLDPIQRRDESSILFNSLPKDAKALKKLPKKPKSKNAIHSSWHNALVPTIGGSQDVRRDKFVRYVECGAIHHCRACLKEGIDVNLTNEYNQSTLKHGCF